MGFFKKTAMQELEYEEAKERIAKLKEIEKEIEKYTIAEKMPGSPIPTTASAYIPFASFAPSKVDPYAKVTVGSLGRMYDMEPRAVTLAAHILFVMGIKTGEDAEKLLKEINDELQK